MPETAGAGCLDRLRSGRCMRPRWWHLSAASEFAIGGGPGVGWFPLAPGEVYVPYYRGSRGYVERVNVTNTVVNVTRVTNVYNVYNSNATSPTSRYVNQRVNNGVTLVSRDTFVNARPVGRNLGRFDARQLAEAPVERSIPVQPVRASVLGSGAPARFRPPQSNHQSPGSCDPETGSSPAAFRAAAGGDQRAHRAARCQPQPLSARASNVRWRVRNSPCVRQSAHKPRMQSAVVPKPVRSSRMWPRGRPNRCVREGRRWLRVRRKAGEPERQRPSSQGWSHPQARPAPPVQERNAAQARDDENKFRNWQQQRQQAAPPQNRAPQEQHPGTPAAGRPQNQQRRTRSLSVAGKSCQLRYAGTGNFFYPPNHALHDRLLRTGNWKLGTGFFMQVRVLFFGMLKDLAGQASDSLNLARKCHAGRRSQPLRAAIPR